jgi:hypothetical protein
VRVWWGRGLEEPFPTFVTVKPHVGQWHVLLVCCSREGPSAQWQDSQNRMTLSIPLQVR